MTDKETQIADLIKDQFPRWEDANNGLAFGSKNESDFRRLIDMLYHINNDGLKYILGPVLYGLLLSHPSTLKRDSSYRKLMLFLDAGYSDCEFKETVEIVETAYHVAIESEAIKDVVLDKQERFKTSLAAQAKAISQWIVLAEDWECSRGLSFEFKSAKVFWTALADDADQ